MGGALSGPDGRLNGSSGGSGRTKGESWSALWLIGGGGGGFCLQEDGHKKSSAKKTMMSGPPHKPVFAWEPPPFGVLFPRIKPSWEEKKTVGVFNSVV